MNAKKFRPNVAAVIIDQKNRKVSLSSMMHAPLIFNQSVASPFLPEKPKLLYPIELQSKPFLFQIKKDDLIQKITCH